MDVKFERMANVPILEKEVLEREAPYIVPSSARSVKRRICLTPISIAALLLFNVLWMMFDPLSHAAITGRRHQEAFIGFNSAMAESLRLPGPHLILLGSSLILDPVIQTESLYLDRPLDRYYWRRSMAMESLIFKQVSAPISVINLSMGGEMASDSYIILEHLIARNQTPATIIYGVAPRDFLDNVLASVDATPIFINVADLTDLPRLYAGSNYDLNLWLNDLMSRLFLVWRDKTDIQTWTALHLKQFVYHLFSWPQPNPFPEIWTGSPHAFPGVSIEHATASQALAAYKLRYLAVHQSAVEDQFRYFEDLLSLCKHKGIVLRIVNMPLPDENKILIPSGFYQEYLQRLKALCTKYDVDFSDFSVSPWTNLNNFQDAAHLKPAVSPPFLEQLTEVFAKSYRRSRISLK